MRRKRREYVILNNNKLHHISYDDAILFAKDNGIRRADAIIKEVADSLRQFREIAKRHAVQDRWISSIESAINTYLVSWGLEDEGNISVAFEIEGISGSGEIVRRKTISPEPRKK